MATDRAIEDFGAEVWASESWFEITFDDYNEGQLEDGTPLSGRIEVELYGNLYYYGVVEDED